MATYKEMRLYNEIKVEMQNVLEAEENSKAWKDEARVRMKDVNALIVAAQKVNKDIEIDRAELVKEIREELTAEAEEAAAYEEGDEDYPEVEDPTEDTAD